MASTTFTAGLTRIAAAWLNEVNTLVHGVFAGATTAALARTALGLGTMATQNASAVSITGGTVVGITDLAIADGGTGSSTAAAAIAALGGLPLAGGLMTGPVNFTATTMANHATTADIWSANNVIFMSSAVTVTAIPNSPVAGCVRWISPAVGTVYTHNGANISIEGSANYTTAAGDWIRVISQSTTNNYLTIFKGDGTPVAIPAATQAQMESATSNVTVATPANVNWHPGVAKAWVNFNGTGTIAVRTSYNLDGATPLVDNGTGDYTINIGTDFSGTNYVVQVSVSAVHGSSRAGPTGLFTSTPNVHQAPAAGSFRILTQNGAIADADVDYIMITVFGDQ